LKCCDGGNNAANVEKGIPDGGSINSRAERSPGWLKESGRENG